MLAVCRPGSENIRYLPKAENFRILERDLSGLRELSGMVAGSFDGFFHLGWAGSFGRERDSAALQLANVQNTLDAVDAAKDLGCGFFLGAGSQAEYGLLNAAANEDTPLRPVTMYGAAKLSAGALSRVRAAQRGIKHVWTRIFSVYGPFDEPRTLIYYTINTLLRRETPSLTAGTQIWDYLYSGDAARALAMAAENGKGGETYCIGGGKARPLREYIETIRDIVSPGAALGFGKIPFSPTGPGYLATDISRLERDTGFAPAVPFAEGIQKTLDFIQEGGY